MTTKEQIFLLFEKTFEDTNLGYDVSEIKFMHKGVFTIKFWIENLGTVIETFDYNALKETLSDLKSDILENSLKCPICQSENIKNDICECGAKFIRSNICKASNNETVSSFNHFPEFIEKIHQNTLISIKAISLYIKIGGNLSDIIIGADYVYEGLNKFPIFVISNSISLKSNIEPSIKKVLFYCLMANDDKYIPNEFYDNQYKETNFYLEKNDNSRIIIKAPERQYYNDYIFENKVSILFPYDRNELCEIYIKHYSLNYNDDEASDLVTVFDEWFIDKYYEGYTDNFHYETYFVYELDIPENINNIEDYKKTIHDFMIQCNEEIEMKKKLAIEHFEEFNIYQQNQQFIWNK